MAHGGVLEGPDDPTLEVIKSYYEGNREKLVPGFHRHRFVENGMKYRVFIWLDMTITEERIYYLFLFDLKRYFQIIPEHAVICIGHYYDNFDREREYYFSAEEHIYTSDEKGKIMSAMFAFVRTPQEFQKVMELIKEI